VSSPLRASMPVVSLFFLALLVGGAASPHLHDSRLTFPTTRVLAEIRDAHLSDAGSSSETPCSSLNGPVCPVAMLESSTDQDDAYQGDGESVLARVNALSVERAQVQARRAREESATHKKKAMGLEKERLARVRLAEKVQVLTDAREDHSMSTQDTTISDNSRRKLTAAEYFAAMASASADVQCALCEALAKESHAFAGTATKTGGKQPETRVLEHIRELCKGDLPLLMHSLAILPRPPDETGDEVEDTKNKKRFVLCERDGQSSLTNFEQRAFQSACAAVVDAVDLELAEIAVVAAKTTKKTETKTTQAACGSFCDIKVENDNAKEISITEQESLKEPADVSAEETLLTSGFDGGACVHSAKGYWAWEVCFGGTVRQFHAEYPTVTKVVSLGVFEAQGTGGGALPETDLPPAWREHRLRYVEQFFVGGAMCGGVPTEAKPNRQVGLGRARRTVVRWACAPDGVERVTTREPSPCVYVATVFTNALCAHPEFKPVPPVGGEQLE
jgi:hypothetical protein